LSRYFAANPTYARQLPLVASPSGIISPFFYRTACPLPPASRELRWASRPSPPGEARRAKWGAAELFVLFGGKWRGTLALLFLGLCCREAPTTSCGAQSVEQSFCRFRGVGRPLREIVFGILRAHPRIPTPYFPHRWTANTNVKEPTSESSFSRRQDKWRDGSRASLLTECCQQCRP
jgi:hypothetical protein